jgi:hypothetical protein
MTTVLDLPLVSECTVAGCAHNHDGCHAGAITVGGAAAQASCETFISLDSKGGLEAVLAHVGACQRSDCVHNSALECTADSVRVGMRAGSQDSMADCLTYSPR